MTPTGQDAIQAAAAFEPREKDFLHFFQQLEKEFPREMSRGALETAILRTQAISKFPQAEKMYFTREALEQASSFEVASHRAERFQGYAHIVDLGCSIGGDTLALAAAAHTIGIDRDPLRLAMAKENARVVGLAADFIQNNLLSAFPCFWPSPSTALFFDPARRAGGRRIFSVEGYHPPLSTVEKWLPDFPDMGVKLSPAV
ncbi:class I SAM-dependent methyltransferase [Chloroflexota bacterium]